MTLPDLIEQNEVDLVHAENAVMRLREPASGETTGQAVDRMIALAAAKAELRTRRQMAVMLVAVTS